MGCTPHCTNANEMQNAEDNKTTFLTLEELVGLMAFFQSPGAHASLMYQHTHKEGYRVRSLVLGKGKGEYELLCHTSVNGNTKKEREQATEVRFTHEDVCASHNDDKLQEHGPFWVNWQYKRSVPSWIDSIPYGTFIKLPQVIQGGYDEGYVRRKALMDNDFNPMPMGVDSDNGHSLFDVYLGQIYCTARQDSHPAHLEHIPAEVYGLLEARYDFIRGK